MKRSTGLILLTLIATHLPSTIAADGITKLQKASEKDALKADKHEQKAEIDVDKNKLHGAQRQAHKAAVDEIKSDKEEQQVQAKKSESGSTP